MKKSEKRLRTKYNFVRLNLRTGDFFNESLLIVTDAENDVIEEHIKTAIETGEDEVRIF